MKTTKFKKCLRNPIIKTSLLSYAISFIICAVFFPISYDTEVEAKTTESAAAYTVSYIEEVHDALEANSLLVTEDDIAEVNTNTLVATLPVVFEANDFEELYKVTSSNELVDSEDEEFTATDTPAIFIETPETEEETATIEDESVPVVEEIQEVIEQPKEVETPTEEVVEIPSEDDVQEDNSKSNMTYMGQYRVTGYDTCATCNGNSSGLTAMGTYITPGRTVAMMDYPLGTKIYIEGIGYRTVEDRGNFPVTTIDLAVHSHEEAYAITGYYEVYLVNE